MRADCETAIWTHTGLLPSKPIRLTRRLAGCVLALLFVSFTRIENASAADMSASAIFAGEDTVTQGNWKSRYGLDGFEIFGDASNHPAYAAVRTTEGEFFAWNPSTTDARALVRSNGTNRLAATWLAPDYFIVDLNFTDGRTHRVSFYLMDWDRRGRIEQILVVDGGGRILDSRNVENFEGGKYVSWDIQGHVTIRIIRRGLDNAVLSGIFFDASPAPAVKSDFDRDGQSDLLFQDANGLLAVWFLKEPTLSSVLYLESARYLSPNSVDQVGDRLAATGDFDRDGNDDILFQQTDGGLKIWPMSGTVRLNAQSTRVIPDNPGDSLWRVFDAADLNNDRKVDLLFQHADGTLAVWFMDGVRLNSAAVLAPNRAVDSRWRAAGVVKTDSLGNTELVMQHESGALELWSFNGTRQYASSPFQPSNLQSVSSVAGTFQISEHPGIRHVVFQALTYHLFAWSISGTNVHSHINFGPMNSGGTWSVMGRLLPSVGYNSPPVITSIGNLVTDRDRPTAPVSFFIDDKETATGALVLTGTSSNPALVPNSNISISGGGEFRTVSVQPVRGQQGTATITLAVTDLGVINGAPRTATTSFVVTVRGNQAPTITSIGDQTIPVNSATPELGFWVADAETPATSLSVSARSSNPSLVPFANIRISGTGAVRSVQVSPQSTLSGTSIITLTVNDGNGGDTSTSFAVKVAGHSRARFVESDLVTQGDWTARYGRDGFYIPLGQYWSPSGTQVTASLNGVDVPLGESSSLTEEQIAARENMAHTWTLSTKDPRALVMQGFGGNRLATCWFASQRLELDVSIPEGAPRRVALYVLDWDSFNRSQTVEILDAAGVELFDARTVTGFHDGKYLVWEIEGHVTIRITNAGGSNIVISGLFFDFAPPPSSEMSAVFVAEDTQTRGEWASAYGRDGYDIVRGGTRVPSFAKVSVLGAQEFTWVDPTLAPEALRKANTTGRLAACWFSDQSFDVRLDFLDKQMHRVAFYFLDYANPELRTQRVEILDAFTGSMLSVRTISNFRTGRYLVWDLRGSVIVRVTSTTRSNAVLSGLFFDSAPAVAKGDLDGDGQSDLVWQDTDGKVYAWLMNGINRREQIQLSPAGSGDPKWRLAGTSDFNRDGHTDLLWQHSDGWSAIWFMKGVRLERSTYTLPPMIGAKQWQIAATGDFDHDQSGDIVWQRDDGAILVWFMNAENMTRSALVEPNQPNETGLRVVATGDFDGNGDIDLVLQPDTGGPGRVWYLEGLRRIREATMIGGVGQGWRIVGAGDFRNDTRVDVLWQFTGGETAVWLMNEATEYLGAEFTPRRPENSNWKLVGPK